LVRVKVTTNAGLLPPPDYKGPTRDEIFKVGTEPKEIDTEILQKLQINIERRERLDLPHYTINWMGVENTLDFDPEVQAILDMYLKQSIPQSEDYILGDPFAPLELPGYNELTVPGSID
jgi:hypothetical protein